MGSGSKLRKSCRSRKKSRSSVWLLNKNCTLVFDKFSPSSQRCVVALQWAVQHLAQPFVANFVQTCMQCAHVYFFSLADKSYLILETVFRSVKGKVFSF